MKNLIQYGFSFVTILILFLIGCAKSIVTPIDLAHQFIENYEGYTSTSYDLNYQIKYFDQTGDTTKLTAKVDLIREKKDSVVGGYIWITADSVSTYYNTEALYSINHTINTIFKYPITNTSALTGNILHDTYNTYFLKPTRLISAINDTLVTATLTDETLSKRPVWRVNYKIKDSEDLKNVQKNIWIDKAKLTTIKINYFAEYQGENQYNQWDFKNLSFNTISIEDLENRLSFFVGKYKMEEYQEKDKNPVASQSNGTVLPNLEGFVYSDLSAVNLHDYLDKLTLYDLWYIDCPACIKAIPHLNDLYNKYSDMGLKVVGVNPFNNNEKDLKRMPNFLSYNKIDYPIVFVDREKSNALKVQVYPTFYLVDNQGNILHSEVGFNKEKVKILDEQLNEYLTGN